MAENTNKNAKFNNKQEVQQEVKEVLVKTIKDTSTPPTKPEERAKIEAEVTMIKVGIDFSGNWQFKRSDRMTDKDKEKRNKLVECVRKGFSKQQIIQEFRNSDLL